MSSGFPVKGLSGHSTAARLIVVFLILATLAAMAALVSKSGPLLSVHARYWDYAIPAALTERIHGVRGFVIFDEITQELAPAAKLDNFAAQNKLIEKAAAVQLPVGAVAHLFPGDEKGAVDFVKISFDVFGVSVQSLFYLYAAIFFVSVAVYLICYLSDFDALVLLLLMLAALFLVIRVLPISSELGGIINQRAIGLLSAVSALHVMLGIYKSMQATRPLLVRIIATSVLQLAIIVFVSNMREAETWYIIYLAGAGIATAGIGFSRPRKISGKTTGGRHHGLLIGPASLVLIIALSFSALQVYKRQAYDPRYFQTHLAGKIFWHNVGIGFALNPGFAATYQLQINDASMMDAVRRQIEAQDPSQVNRVFAPPDQVIARYAPGYIIDFVLYEQWARRLVLKAVADCPFCAIQLMFFDKPRLFIKQALWASGLYKFSVNSLMLNDQAGALRHDLRPSRAGAVCAFLVFGALISALAWLRHRRPRNTFAAQDISPLVLFSGLIAACSFAPVILTYPLIHLLAAPFLWSLFFLAIAAYCSLSRRFEAKRLD